MTHPTHAIVDDVHQLLEGWLARGEGDIERLADGLDPNYTIANPDGTITTASSVVANLTPARGQAPGLTFVIKDFEIVAESGDVCVASYIEAQEMPNGQTERRTLSVFIADNDAPGGYRWLRSHETWINQP